MFSDTKCAVDFPGVCCVNCEFLLVLKAKLEQTLYNSLINPLELFNPLPALNNWFCKRERHSRQNDKAEEQEWFAGVFSQASAEIGCLPENPSNLNHGNLRIMEMELEEALASGGSTLEQGGL